MEVHPTLEKLITLRSVSMFAETSDEILTELVGVVDETFANAGTTIIQQGDLGSSLYIIVEGRVRVHDGERTLSFLGKRDVFGEMAALDPERRSATVTAVDDTRLLRLDREPLFALMSARPEITRGILHVLCERLRARIRDLADDFTYMQQFARVTAAAAAVEAGIYEPESLDEVARRTDALGQLTRVFQRMAREVHGREQRLRQQVERLRIEIDEAKLAREVSAITESDYFKSLTLKARQLRQARTQSAAELGGADYEAAARHALERLTTELSHQLHYHSVEHTRDEVVPTAEKLAAMEGMTGEELLLLRTAAWFHDIGFVEQPTDNEAIGARIAAAALPRFGYSPAQIEVTTRLIMATRLPQAPRSRLEEVLADADLAVFGTDEFLVRNAHLRAELQELGASSTDDEWYGLQLAFMQSHAFFTESARSLLDEKKRANLRKLAEYLGRTKIR
jgi:uncharacterized protein